MSGKPVNRRVQFTKNALREAMIELITEKPLTSITVKDVCARMIFSAFCMEAVLSLTAL